MKKLVIAFILAFMVLTSLPFNTVFAEEGDITLATNTDVIPNEPTESIPEQNDNSLLVIKIYKDPESQQKKIFYELKEELFKRGYSLEEIETFKFDYEFNPIETEEVYPVLISVLKTNDNGEEEKIDEVKCVFYVSQEILPEIYINDFFIEVEAGDKVELTDLIDSINMSEDFLKIKGEVNFNKDGEYVVNYVLGDGLGNKDESQLTILVATSQATIEARYLAEDDAIQRNRDEAERRAAKKREEKRIAEQQARQAQLIAAGLYTDSVNPRFGSGNNPYPGTYWNNCTWSAWQLLHDIRGIDMPPWGDAKNWLVNAQRDGWATGSQPQTGSIIVMSGHVAYVAEVSEDGTMIFIREGNIKGKYNEGWVSAYGPIHGQYVQGYIYP